MISFRHLALLTFVLLAGCSSSPEIDSYVTFNIVRSANFPVSNGATAGVDTSITVQVSIDTTDYNRQESSAYLLHTARVGRIVLSSSEGGFTLDNLANVRLLIGTDTVGIASILLGTSDTLIVTQKDITPHVMSTGFPATLQFKFNALPSQPVTLSADMTIIHTALHTPLE